MILLVAAVLAVPQDLVAKAEADRVAVVQKIAPTAVALFLEGGTNGGSGVLISADGYALTNYHVSGDGPALKAGLSDGKLYDVVVVGVDPVGDLALVKLLGRTDFPFSTLGDSDALKLGEPLMAIGNPFLLADDFQPTVTLGVVSGLHRYQPGAGTLLEYADCIQTDAAINPGNSGGPLFNSKGEVVGINGRGSFEKRGRVNVGVGYAISINQIKNFLGLLRGGWIVDHATLGAVVAANEEGRIVVDQLLTSSDAFRLGLRTDDEIVHFGGRPIGSVNAFKNVLGIYPRGMRVPLTYRRGPVEATIHPRVMGVHRPGQLEKKLSRSKTPDKMPEELKKLIPQPKIPPAVAKVFERKSGYANYYFNRLNRDRLLLRLERAPAGRWRFVGKSNGKEVVVTLADKAVAWESDADRFIYLPSEERTLDPPGTNGLLVALWQWRQILTSGARGFDDCRYWGSLRNDSEFVETSLGAVESRWSFGGDGRLQRVEVQVAAEGGPCDLIFSGRKNDAVGRPWPAKWTIEVDGKTLLVFDVERIELAP
jgi:serine protease Do